MQNERWIGLMLSIVLCVLLLGCTTDEPKAVGETDQKDSLGEVVAFPASKGFQETVTVSLSYETEGFTIFYTTDGTAPSASSPVYTEPIHISASTLLTAVAVNDQDMVQATPPFQALYLQDALLWVDAADVGTLEFSSEQHVSSVADKAGNYLWSGVGEHPQLVMDGLHGQSVFRFHRGGGFWLDQSLGSFAELTAFIVHQRLVDTVHDSRYARLFSSIADPKKDVWVHPNFHYMVPVEPDHNNITAYEARIDSRRFSDVEAGPLGIGLEAKLFSDWGVVASGAFVGDIAELIMVGRPLNPAERELISTYLHRKWGLQPMPEFVLAVPQPEAKEPVIEAMVTDPAQLAEASLSQALKALESESTEIVWAARERLQEFGEEAVPLLSELLQDVQRDWPVRWSALRVLGQIGLDAPELVMPVLTVALEDPVPNIRGSAASNLGRLGSAAASAVGSLTALAVMEQDDDVRTHAIDALASIGVVNDQVLGAIGLAVGENILSVAMAGNRAVRSLGADQQSIAYVLIDFLQQGRVAESRIINAFRRIGAPTIPALEEMISSAHEHLRYQITHILGLLLPDSTDVLVDLLQDSAASVRREAISALGQARREADRMRPLLMAIGQDETELDTVRFAAARSLLELGFDWESDEATAVVTNLAEHVPGDLYVAKNGHDRWSGRVEQPLPDGSDGPFASLERARDEIRRNQVFDQWPAGGVTVWIGGGTYYLQESFSLTEADSGVLGSPVTYRAVPGEHVVLSGGQALDPAWFGPVTDTEVLHRIICEDARRHVLQVDLRQHGVVNYGQLSRIGFRLGGEPAPMEVFIDGSRMILARWPNQGTVEMAEVVDPGPKFGEAGFLSRGGTFQYAYDRPHSWKQAEDIWLEGIFGYSWEWSFNKVDAIDVQRQEITLAYGEVSGLMQQWYADHHVFENLLEEIDVPGEYFLDRNQGILYLYPPAEFSATSQIYVSGITEPLVATRDVAHVQFQDLDIQIGRGLGIRIDGGESVSVINCRVSNVAGSGIRLDGDRHQVINSHIFNVGANGIAVFGGDWATLSGGGHRLENNKIHANGYRQKVYNPAISLNGVGHQVRHNEVFATPHAAVIVRGNDHLIEYNEIHNVATDYSDMGAIYMHLGGDPAQRGTVIRRNYFHHIGQDISGVFGVYLDGGTMGVTVEENVLYRVGFPNGIDAAIYNNSGQNNHIRHNIFVDCTVPYEHGYNLTTAATAKYAGFQQSWEQLFSRYDLASMPHSKYPGLLTVRDPENYYRFTEYGRRYPNTSTFLENVAFNPSVRLRDGQIVHFRDRQLDGDVDRDQLLVSDGNVIASSDPGFVDWANQDFRLNQDAPLLEQIPALSAMAFAAIGLTGPVGPAGVATADVTQAMMGLESDNPEVVWAAREKLEKLGLQAVSALTELLQDEQRDWPLRWSALRVLSRIGASEPEAVLPALMGALADTVPNIRAAAASSLGRLGSVAENAAVDLVTVALHDQDQDARVQAIGALGEIGALDESVLAAVGLGLGDPNLTVAMAANRALRSLGGARETVALALFPLLRDQVVPADQVLQAYQRLGATSVGSLQTLAEADSELERVLVARILAEISPAGWEILAQLIDDPTASVRREALASLGHANAVQEDVLPILAAVAMDNAEDAYVRHVALRSLLSLDQEYISQRPDLVDAAQQLASHQPRDWFVSRDGNDSWSGRYPDPLPDGTDGPFATLERARDEIRRAQVVGLPAGGVNVWIRGGLYPRTRSFVLGEEDSGSQEAPITYRAYPGEEVRFSGGLTLDPSWLEPVRDSAMLSHIIDHTARPNILQVDLRAHGIVDLGQISIRGFRAWEFGTVGIPQMELFIDHQPMTLSRWPKVDKVAMGEVVDRRTFTYDFSRPELWTYSDDIWVSGVFSLSWAWFYHSVASIDHHARTLTLRNDNPYGFDPDPWGRSVYYFENVFEEISEPGDYYIDRSTGILYLLPPIAFDPMVHEMTVTMLGSTMIVLDGVSHVSIKDIILEAGRANAVQISGGDSCTLENSIVRNFTGTGVQIASGTNHGVANSHIYNIGGRGVGLAGGDFETLKRGENYARHNLIHDVAYFNQVYQPAIGISGVGNHIVQNQIYNAPHVGIILGGNDHRIEYNEIHNVCSQFQDMGAIYLNASHRPWERGHVIRRNFFHHIGQDNHVVKVLYFDWQAMGSTVEENVFYQIGRPGSNQVYAIAWASKAQDMTVRHNIFVDTFRTLTTGRGSEFIPNAEHDLAALDEYDQQVFAGFGRYNHFEGMPHLERYPELGQFWQRHPLSVVTNTFDESLIVNINIPLATQPAHGSDPPLNSQGFAGDLRLVHAENNLVFKEDPGFLDYSQGDFSLGADSVVWLRIPNFPHIRLEEMGLQGTVGPFFSVPEEPESK